MNIRFDPKGVLFRSLVLGKGAENQNGNLRWHLPWALYYVYIVDEMTLKMAK